ncbi:hypothetical protein DFH09DRAFT_1119455 [Mycena vulgaris]|nr:hypothetical protein DFH09DRAFT_1119455 [Mycena vulgaris]
MLEWAWGLEYGTLDEHVDKLSHPLLENIIIVAHSALVEKVYLLASNLPLSATESRTIVQGIYEGCKSFEYFLLPVNPSSEIAPRVLICSSTPDDIRICRQASQVLRVFSVRFQRGAKVHYTTRQSPSSPRASARRLHRNPPLSPTSDTHMRGGRLATCRHASSGSKTPTRARTIRRAAC